MKKKIAYILPLLLSLLSCGKDEVNVSVKDVTIAFKPADSDQSVEANLRRDFYSKYGSYLLFNDTLQHYVLGKDANGDDYYFTEVIDVQYEVNSNISGDSNTKYRYNLIATDEQKIIATQFMEEYILTHISGKLAPYSWLLVDKISKTFNGSTETSPYAVGGQRTVVIATNVIPRLSASQKEQYSRQLMNTIISQVASDNADAFEEFYNVSQNYYNGKFTAPSTTKEKTDILARAGFICVALNEFNNEEKGTYPNRDLDLKAFSRLIAANTQEKINEKYADYPLVIKKSAIIRKLLTSLGYKE